MAVFWDNSDRSVHMRSNYCIQIYDKSNASMLNGIEKELVSIPGKAQRTNLTVRTLSISFAATCFQSLNIKYAN